MAVDRNPMQWFRCYAEIVDDEKLRLLAFEDRWHFIAILACKASGIIDEAGPLMRRKVAVKLGLDVQALEEVVRRLCEVELIDRQTLQPLAWDRRQYRSDTSAERTRAYRDKKKRHGDVTVTPPETEADTETEEEREARARANEAGEQPEPPEERDSLTPDDIRPEVRLAIVARQFGIDCNGSDPRLIALAGQDVDVATFTAACEQARKGRDGERITVALPIRILEDWAKQAKKLAVNGARPPARASPAATRIDATIASLTGRHRTTASEIIDVTPTAAARLG